jgi:bacillithiol biosynthesis cysteine-adding enzyme BshC
MKSSTVYTTPKKNSVWETLLQKGKTEFSLGKGEDSPELRDRESHLMQIYRKGFFNLDSIQELLEKENPIDVLTEKQKQHIQSLANKAGNSKEPLFVITGQQPSILTGPMLCIHKGLTAIALAEKWQDILQRPVIPLFWIAGDDSDLEECGVVEWLDSEIHFASRLEVEYPSEKIPMSLRDLGDGWETIYQQKKEEWSQDIIDFIQKSITPQDTVTSSAKKILQHVLGSLGLLFVDGFSNTFRKLAEPTMKRVVQEATDLETYVQHASQKWKSQGYKSQVALTKNTVHAFALEEIESPPMQCATQSHLVVRKRLHTTEKTEVYLETNAITHDVLSRPLLIEGVFPVLGHVLGPSELGYFLQLEEAFPKWFGHRPLISPRMSATWMSSKHFVSLQEEGIDKEHIPSLTPSVFRKHFMEQRWNQVVEQQSWKSNISSNLQGTVDFLMAASKLPSHPKYTPLFESFKKRLIHEGDWLEEKLKKAVLEKYESEYQSYRPTLHWLAKGQGQDRHLNWFSLVNTVGEKSALELLKSLDPLEEAHQLLVWDK